MRGGNRKSSATDGGKFEIKYFQAIGAGTVECWSTRYVSDTSEWSQALGPLLLVIQGGPKNCPLPCMWANYVFHVNKTYIAHWSRIISVVTVQILWKYFQEFHNWKGPINEATQLYRKHNVTSLLHHSLLISMPFTNEYKSLIKPLRQEKGRGCKMCL